MSFSVVIAPFAARCLSTERCVCGISYCCPNQSLDAFQLLSVWYSNGPASIFSFQVAFVSGGAAGIGLALVRRLLQLGAYVTSVDIANETLLRKQEREFGDEFGADRIMMVRSCAMQYSDPVQSRSLDRMCPMFVCIAQNRSAPTAGISMPSVPRSKPRSLRLAALIFVSTMQRCLRRAATFMSLAVRLDASD